MFWPDLLLPKPLNADSTMTAMRTGWPWTIVAPVMGGRVTHSIFWVRLLWNFFMPSLHSVAPSTWMHASDSPLTAAAAAAQRSRTGPATCLAEQTL